MHRLGAIRFGIGLRGINHIFVDGTPLN
jgi:hypothetical protein